MGLVKLGWLLSCSAMVLACNGGKYHIEGIAEGHGYDGHNLSLTEFSNNGIRVLDSCVVSHGQFCMNGIADTVRFVMLCKDNVPVIPMYLEKGKTQVNLSPTEMKARGTRQNNLFYDFLSEKKLIDNRFDDQHQRLMQLVQADVVNSQEVGAARDSLQSIIGECENLIYSFVTQNFDEQAAVGVFSMMTFNPGQNGQNEMTPLVKRIVDVAPESFLAVPSVNQYLTRVGYSR